MTKNDISQMRRVCQMVAEDVANDARNFDGKPLEGRIVAEYFGNHGAAIAALARTLDELLAEREKGGD